MFVIAKKNIKNNTIRNVPYTGISLGWGWERQKNSLDVKNNKIINSYGKLNNNYEIYYKTNLNDFKLLKKVSNS